MLDKIKGYIKIKGSRDLNLNKQSYFFELVQYEKFLDFKTKSNKWTLVSNYGDKTLLRNFVALELSRKLEMDYTIDCKPIDLMVNGEYKGTYNLCENVDVSENKVNIEKMDKDDLKEPELTGGYLLEINGFAYFGNHYINSKRGIPVSIRDPEEENEIQSYYINEKFDELEMEVFDNNFTKIDNNTFINYFLIEEIIGNSQAYWNTYIYKKRNSEIFYFGPIYDNNYMGFDNDQRAFPVNCKRNYAFNYGLSAGTADKFINQIISNNETFEKIKEKWKNIYENKLKIEDINAFIDKMEEYINESRILNFMRWDILNKKVAYNPKTYGSYEEEINALKDFIKHRINWLNDKILNSNSYYQQEARRDLT